ncbi:MAG: PTS sugar transporter subunit IIA [Planctomycetia bacterium]|nr:PTS sugar transporter subunit IIA [Planctomycetia bacterium]
MLQSTYTLSELALYLKESEKQVQKYAEQGIIQGRKVQGKWVFAAADVILLLEKMLNHPENEKSVVSVEKVVNQNVSQEDRENFSILDYLSEDSIIIPFSAKTTDSVIRKITAFAADIGKLWVPEDMAAAIRKREEMMSTAMENGVALLHPRRPLPDIIAETFLVLGIAPRGIPFGGGFNNLTDIFFMICCTNDKIHLRILARLGRILGQVAFLDQLRELESPAEIIELISVAESKIVSF